MKNDFGKGAVWKVILRQAIPLLLAQLVHLLYNVVDRIYLGHMADAGSLALTGVGLIFPLTTLIAAVTNLFSSGGAPLFSIARGAGEEDKAAKLLNQVTGGLLGSSVILFFITFFFRKPILFLFGASEASYVYADLYLRIYLFGTTATMLATGLNGFINAQGYPRIGMNTIVIGAIINIILDPVFIFLFHMGVAGAALATVISQFVSCYYVIRFFLSSENRYRLDRKQMLPDPAMYREITGLGITGFVMQGTNSLVSIICNVTLRTFGGDLYVGIMTVLNSVRELLSLPAMSIPQGATPVLSYNYGAKQYSRIRKGIIFMSASAFLYTLVAWILVLLYPRAMMSVFTGNTEMIETGTHALILYFFGFVFMALQMVGQNVFTSLKCRRRALFFSLFRKVIIVVPLTILLPRLGFGVDGVYLAEPVSNVLGGLACYITMFFTIFRRLPEDGTECLL